MVGPASRISGQAEVIAEASASLDAATDAAIQKTLRTAFDSCTILVVAHRISTVVDLDIVAVLSHGKLVEIGSPPELLALPDGHFKRMAGEEVVRVQ
jgi:ABC-type multidrug transport system fused ATPase/permease subunit